MSAIATLGMVAATLGGGVLVDTFGWRSIFLARVPLTLITILLAFAILAEYKTEGKQRFDLRGAALAFVRACLPGAVSHAGRQKRLAFAHSRDSRRRCRGHTRPATTIGAKGAASCARTPKLLTHPLLAPVITASFLMFNGDIREPVHTAVLCVRRAQSRCKRRWDSC